MAENKKISKTARSSGFSLMELMIFIVVVGVLAAVAVPIYNRNVEYAKRAEGEATMGSIRSKWLPDYGLTPWLLHPRLFLR
ncbi:prepilin-type N-terminal cleavage/methylation domain-containing protein, partial [bacterium]|nr:prepilin-type N-terminal cleavage/methylation domain-containing protein [bacterium]